MNFIQKILLESELDDQNEFDINSFFKPNPNPNQLERYKEDIKNKFFYISRLNLVIKRMNKAFENKE